MPLFFIFKSLSPLRDKVQIPEQARNALGVKRELGLWSVGDTALSHGTPPASSHTVCGPLTLSLHRGAGTRGAFRPGALGEEMPVALMGARLLPGRQPRPWLWEHPLRQEVGTARPQREEKHPWVRFIPGEGGAGTAPQPTPKVWDTLSESCLRCALAGRLGRPDGSQVLLATTPRTPGGDPGSFIFTCSVEHLLFGAAGGSPGLACNHLARGP